MKQPGLDEEEQAEKRRMGDCAPNVTLNPHPSYYFTGDPVEQQKQHQSLNQLQEHRKNRNLATWIVYPCKACEMKTAADCVTYKVVG